MVETTQPNLSLSLKSGGNKTPRPLTKYLLAQGVCPDNMSAWCETGIPESQLVFVLEFFAYERAKPKAIQYLRTFTALGVHTAIEQLLGPVVKQVQAAEEDYERVKGRVEANKELARIALAGGVRADIAHDNRTTAISGRRTSHWRAVSGHDKWQDCLPMEEQAVMMLASILHAKGMEQAQAAGLKGTATLSKGNQNVRGLRAVVGPVLTPGHEFTFHPGTKRANQLGTVEKRNKRLKAQSAKGQKSLDLL
jgi:hypothetical protein